MDEQEKQEKNEQEMLKFSWTGLLLVTGCSSLIFSYVVKILDGNHSRFLLLTGSAAVFLGILCWIVNAMISQVAAERKRKKSNLPLSKS